MLLVYGLRLLYEQGVHVGEAVENISLVIETVNSKHVDTRGQTMAGVDFMLRLQTFHGTEIEDPKQYWFSCKEVWTVKQIPNDGTR